MRGISLWEPWASAMAHGFKEIETRGYPTSYRGELLICAAKKIVDTRALGLPARVNLMKLNHGCALCVVELYDCIPAENCEPHVIAGDEEQLGYYDVGRWAWLTKRRRPLAHPIPWRGKQGLWTLTDAEEKQIQALL